jgi:hypothetical protein
MPDTHNEALAKFIREHPPEDHDADVHDSIKRLAKLPHKTQAQLKEELREAGKLTRGQKPKPDELGDLLDGLGLSGSAIDALKELLFDFPGDYLLVSAVLSSTDGAPNAAVTLKPAERLVDLVAAIKRDPDNAVATLAHELELHGASPSGQESC